MNPDMPAPQQPVNPPAPAPTPAPQPQPMAPAPSNPAPMPMTASGKTNKKGMLIGIIAGAVLVIAGAAYGAYAYVTNTPDYLFKQATSQLVGSSQQAFAAKFKLATGSGGNSVTISGDFATRSDSANTKNAEYVLGLGTGTSRVTATVSTFDDALYFKLGNLSNLGNLAKSFGQDAADTYGSPEFVAMLSNLNDKWFTVSKEELQGIAEQTGGGSKVTGEFSTQDIKTVATLYDKHSFIRPDKVYDDQDIEGVKSAHFSLKLDRTEYMAFLKDVKAANLKTFKVTDQDLKDAETEPETSDNTTLEAWVARDSKKLTQFEVKTTQQGATTTLTLNPLTELPQLEKLEKPTDAVPMSELYTLLFGPSLSEMMGEYENDF